MLGWRPWTMSLAHATDSELKGQYWEFAFHLLCSVSSLLNWQRTGIKRGWYLTLQHTLQGWSAGWRSTVFPHPCTVETELSQGLHHVCTKTESRLCSFSVGLVREKRAGLLQGAKLQRTGLWWHEAVFVLESHKDQVFWWHFEWISFMGPSAHNAGRKWGLWNTCWELRWKVWKWFGGRTG